jgi:hypothetical protein
MTVLNVFSSNQDSTSDVGNSTRERPYSSHNENLSKMCKDFCAIARAHAGGAGGI